MWSSGDVSLHSKARARLDLSNKKNAGQSDLWSWWYVWFSRPKRRFLVKLAFKIACSNRHFLHKLKRVSPIRPTKSSISQPLINIFACGLFCHKGLVHMHTMSRLLHLQLTIIYCEDVENNFATPLRDCFNSYLQIKFRVYLLKQSTAGFPKILPVLVSWGITMSCVS